MNIAVTGGAGFIGSNLIDDLLKDGHNVWNIDNFDAFYPESIKRNNIREHLKNKNYNFLESDINRENMIASFLDNVKIDAIIHLAAKAGVRPSIEKPKEYFEVNAGGTISMLELARKKGIKKFILASSSSVYGENPSVPWKESDKELKPISPYAASKIAAEEIGRVFSGLYSMDVIALRFFTVYGPRQRPDLAIHKFFELIYNDKPIPFFGAGDTRRDYTFIDDIIKGIRGALNLPIKQNSFRVYNLGNSDTIQLSDLIKIIEKTTGKQALLNRQPEQAGDVKQTFADITKSSKDLGYMPDTQIHEGLKVFNEWFLKKNKSE